MKIAVLKSRSGRLELPNDAPIFNAKYEFQSAVVTKLTNGILDLLDYSGEVVESDNEGKRTFQHIFQPTLRIWQLPKIPDAWMGFAFNAVSFATGSIEHLTSGSRRGAEEFEKPVKCDFDSGAKENSILKNIYDSVYFHALKSELEILNAIPLIDDKVKQKVHEKYNEKLSDVVQKDLISFVNEVLEQEFFIDAHYQLTGRVDYLANYSLSDIQDLFSKPTDYSLYHDLSDIYDHDDIMYTYNFGFQFKFPSGEATLVLTTIVDGGHLDVSFSDVGDGISYSLPVIVQTSNQFAQNVFIQQSELHLHPALQSKLADVFLKELEKKPYPMLVETHSEHLILRVLRRIGERYRGISSPYRVTPQDIAVYYFEPTLEHGTVVTQQVITDEGDFERDWPNGFFTERYEDLHYGYKK